MQSWKNLTCACHRHGCIGVSHVTCVVRSDRDKNGMDWVLCYFCFRIEPLMAILFYWISRSLYSQMQCISKQQSWWSWFLHSKKVQILINTVRFIESFTIYDYLVIHNVKSIFIHVFLAILCCSFFIFFFLFTGLLLVPYGLIYLARIVCINIVSMSMVYHCMWGIKWWWWW